MSFMNKKSKSASSNGKPGLFNQKIAVTTASEVPDEDIPAVSGNIFLASSQQGSHSKGFKRKRDEMEKEEEKSEVKAEVKSSSQEWPVPVSRKDLRNFLKLHFSTLAWFRDATHRKIMSDNVVACGYADGSISIRDMGTGESKASYYPATEKAAPITGLDFMSRGERCSALIGVNAKGVLVEAKSWNSNPKWSFESKGDTVDGIRVAGKKGPIAYFPDKRVVVGDDSERFYVCSAGELQQSQQIEDAGDGHSFSFAVLANDRLVIGVSGDGAESAGLELWKVGENGLNRRATMSEVGALWKNIYPLGKEQVGACYYDGDGQYTTLIVKVQKNSLTVSHYLKHGSSKIDGMIALPDFGKDQVLTWCEDEKRIEIWGPKTAKAVVGKDRVPMVVKACLRGENYQCKSMQVADDEWLCITTILSTETYPHALAECAQVLKAFYPEASINVEQNSIILNASAEIQKDIRQFFKNFEVPAPRLENSASSSSSSSTFGLK